MTINMRVMSASDEEIAVIAANPKRLDHQYDLSQVAELYVHWRVLDYLLGGQSFLVKGDTVLKESKNEPVHVIRTAGLPTIADALQSASESEVRTKLDPARMRAAGLWVPEYPQYANEILPAILAALGELRDVVARASRDAKGLVVWRYES
jgi:hypothetical protein